MNLNIVTCISDYRRGFELEIALIDHLEVVTTSNYNTVANFHTLHFTTTHAKSFKSAVASHFPVTDLNNGDSSATVLSYIRSFLHRLHCKSLTSESELLYDWRFTANQFVLATSPLRPTTRIFIFQLHTCGYSPYVTSSLTRGWLCRLQLLLVLASAVILRSDSRGTHDHILLSQIRDTPNLEGRSPYLYPPGTGWHGYIPRKYVPFSSPPTTGNDTVEVFDPTSIRDSKLIPVITPQHGPCRKDRLLYSNHFCGNMFICEGVTR
jgi:hypothetical protein